MRKRKGNEYEFSTKNIPEIAEEVERLLVLEAQRLADSLVEDDIQMKFDTKLNKYISLLKSNGALNEKFKIETTNDPFRTGRKEKYSAKRVSIRAAIYPLVELYVKNNYVNSYFLNQLVTGNYAFYSSSGDLLKRMIGVFAPGIRGLVDSNVGMKETYKTLILEDTTIDAKTNEDVLRNALQVTESEEAEFQRVLKFFGDSGYDMTDAQGFMLPSRVIDLGRGFERAWYRGAVHKPVHFELQLRKSKTSDYTSAVPTYIKYSAVELSDYFLDSVNSPLLYKLRANMERLGVDEMVFASAVKAGKPLATDNEGNPYKLGFKDFVALDDSQINQLKGFANPPILELSNRHFRLQHNAASDPNKKVAIYTQLMYFLNAFTNAVETDLGVHGSLKEQADRVYGLVGELIKIGREEFTAKVDTTEKLYKFLKSKLDGPSSERVLELVESGISLNNPLVEKKAIIALASGMESETVRVKFSGGKLVLVTAEGYHFATGEQRQDELSYSIQEINGVKTLLVDAVVPAEMLTYQQLQALKEGRSLYVYGDAIGFRIPSTELHSAVALRVVNVFEGPKRNLIMVPKEIVPIHGSDFDVDSVFVVVREIFAKNETSILTASTINDFQTKLSDLLNTLTELEEGLTDDQRLLLVDYKNKLRERVGLFQDIKDFDPVVDNQQELEDEWQDFVTTPNYSSETKSKVIRADKDDFYDRIDYYRNE